MADFDTAMDSQAAPACGVAPSSSCAGDNNNGTVAVPSDAQLTGGAQLSASIQAQHQEQIVDMGTMIAPDTPSTPALGPSADECSTAASDAVRALARELLLESQQPTVVQDAAAPMQLSSHSLLGCGPQQVPGAHINSPHHPADIVDMAASSSSSSNVPLVHNSLTHLQQVHNHSNNCLPPPPVHRLPHLQHNNNNGFGSSASPLTTPLQTPATLAGAVTHEHPSAAARNLFSHSSSRGLPQTAFDAPVSGGPTDGYGEAVVDTNNTIVAAGAASSHSSTAASFKTAGEIDSILAETPRKYMYVWLKSTMSGEPIPLRLRPKDTLHRMKVKVLGKTNVAVHIQQLLLGDKPLSAGPGQDDTAINATQLGIQEGSVLTLVPRLHSGPLRARTPEGQPSSAEAGGVTEQMLMEAIASRVSLDQVRQQLIENGKPMHFVARINGRFALVRLNAQQQAEGSSEPPVVLPSSSPAEDPQARVAAASQHDECMGAAGADNNASDQHQATTRAKVHDVLARLQERKASGRPRPHHHHHAASSTVAAAAASVSRPALAAPARAHPVVLKSVSGEPQGRRRPRCDACSAKVPLVHYPCKCGKIVCNAHRLAHGCTYDYRAGR